MKTKKSEPNMTNALILDKDDYALLIHNIKNGQDRWEFPGGKVEEGDKNLEERTIKEVEEELGIKIKIKKVLEIILQLPLKEIFYAELILQK